MVHCTYTDFQVLVSQDEELICLLEIASGEAEIESVLAKDGRRDDFGKPFVSC